MAEQTSGSDDLSSMQRRVEALEQELAQTKAALQTRESELQGYAQALKSASYFGDGLVVWGRNAEFLTDPRFLSAYRRGINSGHSIPGEGGGLKVSKSSGERRFVVGQHRMQRIFLVALLNAEQTPAYIL